MGRPTAGGRVEVAGAAVVQAGLGIEFTRGEKERVVKERADDASRRVESRDDVAEGIIRDLVEHRAALVQHQPHRVQVVGPQPVDGGNRPDLWRGRLALAYPLVANGSIRPGWSLPGLDA